MPHRLFTPVRKSLASISILCLFSVSLGSSLGSAAETGKERDVRSNGETRAVPDDLRLKLDGVGEAGGPAELVTGAEARTDEALDAEPDVIVGPVAAPRASLPAAQQGLPPVSLGQTAMEGRDGGSEIEASFRARDKFIERMYAVADALLHQEKKTVLFVGAGESGLSAMAEHFAKHALAKIGDPDIEVLSRDLGARPGSPMPELALRQLKNSGIDAGADRSIAPSADDVRRADLVLAMDAGSRDDLIARFPEATEKAFQIMRFTAGNLAATDLFDPLESHQIAYSNMNRDIRQAAQDLPRRIRESLGGEAPHRLAAGLLKRFARSSEEPRRTLLFASDRDVTRGPMAEFSAKAALEQAGIRDVDVISRSLQRFESDRDVDPLVLKMLSEAGIDASAHKSAPITASEVKRSDVILAMDDEEYRKVLDRFPAAAGKLFLFREWISDKKRGSKDFFAWTYEIKNPANEMPQMYRLAALQIQEAVHALFDSISATVEAAERAADGAARWVYFVCDANMSRSPLAERLFRHRFAEAGLTDIQVASRSRWGGSGHFHIDESALLLRGGTGFMNPLSGQILDEKGIPFKPHVSRGLSRRDARKAEVILVMEERQKEDLEQRFPSTRGKVHLLTEYGGQSGPIIDHPHTIEVFRHLAAQMEASAAGIISKLRRP